VLTERMIAAMHEAEARLNILKPDMEPRATDHIPGMHAMIQTLIDKGYAYAPGNGDVYYRVAKFMGYGSCRAKRSKICASARASRATRPRTIRWTSCCGKASSRASRAGNRRGARVVRAGLSNAR